MTSIPIRFTGASHRTGQPSLATFLSYLRVRLALAILLASLPAAALMAIHTCSEYHDDLDAAARTAEIDTRVLAAAESARLDDLNTLLLVLGDAPDIRGLGPGCSQLLHIFVDAQPQYASLAVADPTGTVRCSSQSSFGSGQVSIGDRDYFKTALSTGRMTAGALVTGRLTGSAIVPVALPLGVDGGPVELVLVAGLDAGWLQRNLERAVSHDETTLAYIDRDGDIVASTLMGASSIGNRYGGIDPLAVGRLGSHPGPDGVQRYHVAAAVGDPGWGLRVIGGVPTGPAFSGARENLLFHAATTVLTLLAAIALISVATHRWFVAPANRLVSAVREISGGDFSAVVPTDSGTRQVDEIGVAIKDMLGSLRFLSGEVDSTRGGDGAAQRGSVFIDLAGRVQAIDAGGLAILGYEPGELKDQSFWTLFPEDSHAHVQALIDEYVASGRRMAESSTIDAVTLRRKDGGTVPVTTTTYDLRAASPAGFVMVFAFRR